MKASLLAFSLSLSFSFLLLAPELRAQDHAVLADPLPEMLVKLQGDWVGKEKGREGECRLAVKGSAMHFTGVSKEEWYKAIAIVTAGVEPAQLSGKITGCSEPAAINQTVLAIFKIENGALTIVGHAPGAPEAPKSFEGDAESRTFIFHPAKK